MTLSNWLIKNFQHRSFRANGSIISWYFPPQILYILIRYDAKLIDFSGQFRLETVPPKLGHVAKDCTNIVLDDNSFIKNVCFFLLDLFIKTIIIIGFLIW